MSVIRACDKEGWKIENESSRERGRKRGAIKGIKIEVNVHRRLKRGGRCSY